MERVVRERAWTNARLTLGIVLLMAAVGLLAVNTGHMKHAAKPVALPPVSTMGKVYGGDHPLRSIGRHYIMVRGSGDESVSFTFAWRDPSGTYRFSTLLANKIRVVEDTSLTTPFVRFRWAGNNNPDDSYVTYAELHIRPSDWTPLVIGAGKGS